MGGQGLAGLLGDQSGRLRHVARRVCNAGGVGAAAALAGSSRRGGAPQSPRGRWQPVRLLSAYLWHRGGGWAEEAYARAVSGAALACPLPSGS
jgi:hypothetical protein